MSAQLRIIGPPRSGTNYVKFLIDNNTELNAGFNVGWWKHAVIPPLMEGTRHSQDDVLSVIMVRCINDQLQAFWHFCKAGRSAISSDATSFSEFLRQPIYMTPFAGSTYFFDSPLSYLAQFYSAAKSNFGQKIYVNLESVQANPNRLFEKFTDLGYLRESLTETTIKLPSGYLGRNIDRHLSDDDIYEDDTSQQKIGDLDSPQYKKLSLLNRYLISLSPANDIVKSIVREAI